jgi:hypothetical protein
MLPRNFVCHLKHPLVEAKMRSTEGPKLPIWRVSRYFNVAHSSTINPWTGTNIAVHLHVFNEIFYLSASISSPVVYYLAISHAHQKLSSVTVGLERDVTLVHIFGSFSTTQKACMGPTVHMTHHPNGEHEEEEESQQPILISHREIQGLHLRESKY